MELDEPNVELEVVRELEPRCDVRVVVELRGEDLVAGPQLPADRAGEREVERRHVLSEHDFFGRAAEEARAGEPSFGDERVAPHARLERPAEVRVRLPQVAGDRVDHRVRHLGAARPVEERPATAEGGEARPDGVDVEGERSHENEAIVRADGHADAPEGARADTGSRQTGPATRVA